jgi:hypothetical protein
MTLVAEKEVPGRQCIRHQHPALIFPRFQRITERVFGSLVGLKPTRNYAETRALKRISNLCRLGQRRFLKSPGTHVVSYPGREVLWDKTSTAAN